MLKHVVDILEFGKDCVVTTRQLCSEASYFVFEAVKFAHWIEQQHQPIRVNRGDAVASLGEVCGSTLPQVSIRASNLSPIYLITFFLRVGEASCSDRCQASTRPSPIEVVSVLDN